MEAEVLEHEEYKLLKELINLITSNKTNLEILNPKQIRMELFKYYYCEDQDYKLYTKGDSGEFT